MEQLTIISIMTGIVILFSVISGILYVLFGQITVKRLRKDPATKDQLGFEFTSGWDILNVAKAFAMPKSIKKKWATSNTSAFYANIELVYKHTSKFEQYLGAIFYWIYLFTAFLILITVFLDQTGITEP